MINNPLISVVIPVYNVEKYLRQCVDSVLVQTYENLEIILVDDGSTDNSAKICDDYAAKDSRIKVIHQNNSGVSFARNVGLEVSNGEYIGFVDADDYIQPDIYQYLYELCESHQVLLSICNYTRIIDGVKTARCPNAKEAVFSCEKMLEILNLELFVWNKLFHKSVIKQVRFRTDVTFGEDAIFCVQTFEKALQIAYGPKAKYNYILNLKSATKQPFNLKKLTYFKAADYILQYTTEHHLTVLQWKIKGQIAYHAVGFLRQIAESNETKEDMVSDLLFKIRKYIFPYLLQHFKLSNKLFAIMCCINFNLAKRIYRFLQKKKK